METKNNVKCSKRIQFLPPPLALFLSFSDIFSRSHLSHSWRQLHHHLAYRVAPQYNAKQSGFFYIKRPIIVKNFYVARAPLFCCFFSSPCFTVLARTLGTVRNTITVRVIDLKYWHFSRVMGLPFDKSPLAFHRTAAGHESLKCTKKFAKTRVYESRTRGIHCAAFKSRLPTCECPEVHVCTSSLSVASPTWSRLLPRCGVACRGAPRLRDRSKARKRLCSIVSDCGSSRDLRRTDAPWVVDFSNTRKLGEPIPGGPPHWVRFDCLCWTRERLDFFCASTVRFSLLALCICVAACLINYVWTSDRFYRIIVTSREENIKCKFNM